MTTDPTDSGCTPTAGWNEGDDVIVCTGPVSSGTRLLTDIVSHLCPSSVVIHRSMPQWAEFWDWQEFPPRTTFVIITRRPDYSVQSAYRQGHGDPEVGQWRHHVGYARLKQPELMEWWWEAMTKLSEIPGAYWLSYEALVASPKTQIGNLAAWLDVFPEWKRVPEVYDGNMKWR